MFNNVTCPTTKLFLLPKKKMSSSSPRLIVLAVVILCGIVVAVICEYYYEETLVSLSGEWIDKSIIASRATNKSSSSSSSKIVVEQKNKKKKENDQNYTATSSSSSAVVINATTATTTDTTENSNRSSSGSSDSSSSSTTGDEAPPPPPSSSSHSINTTIDTEASSLQEEEEEEEDGAVPLETLPPVTLTTTAAIEGNGGALPQDEEEADSDQATTTTTTTVWCNLHASPPIKPTCTIEGNINSINTTTSIICGSWNLEQRTFEHHPKSRCKFRPFQPHEARQCLKGRSLAFVGDSMIRDLGVAVGLFLQDQSIFTASDSNDDNNDDEKDDMMDKKFDKEDVVASVAGYGELIGDIASWNGTNVDVGNCGNGLLFPTRSNSTLSSSTSSTASKDNITSLSDDDYYTYQISVWHLFRNEFLYNKKGSSGRSHASDIIHNRLAGRNNTNGLRPIDYALFSVGMHDWGWWDQPPYVEKFRGTMVNNWDTTRKEEETSNDDPDRPVVDGAAVPSAWVSMNTECPELIKAGFIARGNTTKQIEMVNSVNKQLGEIMDSDQLPYVDADFFLRTPDLCNVTDDGVHVKMWVDQVRASLLFNYWCNDQNEWVIGK